MPKLLSVITTTNPITWSSKTPSVSISCSTAAPPRLGFSPAKCDTPPRLGKAAMPVGGRRAVPVGDQILLVGQFENGRG